MTPARSFFIDENLSPQLAKPLAAIYLRHKFRTADSLQLRGIDDRELFEDLHRFGVGCIITLDYAQLDAPGERPGLRNASLHWLGVPQISERGVGLIAAQLSLVAPAVQHVLSDWPTEPTAYELSSPPAHVIRAQYAL